MSVSLQHSIRLLRRLRPPFRTLAFSCPTEVGIAAWEFPSSNVRDVLATFSSLLYAERIEDNACRRTEPTSSSLSLFGPGVATTFHLLCMTALQTQVSYVYMDRRTRRSATSWLVEAVLSLTGIVP